MIDKHGMKVMNPTLQALAEAAEQNCGQRLLSPGVFFCYPLATAESTVELIVLCYVSRQGQWVWVSMPHPGNDTAIVVRMDFENEAVWQDRDLIGLPFGDDHVDIGTVSIDCLEPKTQKAVWERVEEARARFKLASMETGGGKTVWFLN